MFCLEWDEKILGCIMYVCARKTAYPSAKDKGRTVMKNVTKTKVYEVAMDGSQSVHRV